uniref:G protein-coupled receptor n=1 Tax=Steinernema glaseri TaxID=37863 RepID=A0A1I8ATU8_9BILA
MVVEFLSIIQFHILYFVNLKTRVALRRNVSASQLPEAMAMKYQATENRKTLSFFFPIVWTHFVIYLVRSVTVTIYPMIFAYTPLNHAFYEESTNWMNVYTLFVGIMIIMRFTRLGQRIRKMSSRKIRVCEHEFASVKTITTPQRRGSKEIDHFKQLQNMFERGTL